jgi:hypothetical protein
MVAVVSNGTAVLGLGDIGPLAGKPVMEGKAVLFKKFSGIDVFDIEVSEKDVDRLVDVVAALEGMETLGLIVWERAENRIRFPAAAFYAHQSYIRADNRVEDWPTPQNAEERRESPQNAVSFSLSSSVSVSAPPPNGAAPAPKRSSAKRPGIKALTDEQRERITADFADIPHLGEEIEYALNHTAHDKCRDENLYLRHWLRGTREKLPKVHGKSLDDPFAAMVVKGYDQ